MEKKDILRSLKIDTEEESTYDSRIRPSRLLWGGLILVLLSAIVFFVSFVSQEEPLRPEVHSQLANTSDKVELKRQSSPDALRENHKKSAEINQSISLNASGYVTARRRATVSAQVLGRVTAVNVEEGMYVHKGQVLATLDDAVANIELDVSKARVMSQKARLRALKTELEESQRNVARVNSLGESSLASEAQVTRANSDVEKLKNDIDALNADIRVAELQVQSRQTVLGYYLVKAPFSGVVTTKNAQAGEILAPSSAGGGFTRTGICTIVDMDSLEIEVDVNESFIGRVFSGQKVTANLDAYPDWDIRCRVIAVIPAADRAKATVRVRIKILEKDKRILPDMGVKVAFFDQGTSD